MIEPQPKHYQVWVAPDKKIPRNLPSLQSQRGRGMLLVSSRKCTHKLKHAYVVQRSCLQWILKTLRATRQSSYIRILYAMNSQRCDCIDFATTHTKKDHICRSLQCTVSCWPSDAEINEIRTFLVRLQVFKRKETLFLMFLTGRVQKGKTTWFGNKSCQWWYRQCSAVNTTDTKPKNWFPNYAQSVLA